MPPLLVIGHERNRRYLERALGRGALAHAYLFGGPEAVGKRTLALALGRALLCPTAPETLGGCGECPSCRWADAAAHPDLIVLAADRPLVEEERTREIGIRNVRELSRLASLSAWAGGWKVAIVDGAERLSSDAQAALLKTLEEPLPRRLFVLVTDAPGALSGTIRSRSVALAFHLLADADMAPLSSAVPPGRRAELLALAAGRPGVLARFMAEPQLLSTLRAERENFARLRRADLSFQFTFAASDSREAGRLEEFLAFLARELRAELLASFRARPPAPGDRERPAALRAVLRAAALLASLPVNRRLVAGQLFFELQAASRPLAP